MANEMTSAIGRLPTDWELVALGKLATEIGSGATPRGGAAVYLGQRINYALVRSQNVFDRFFNEEGLAYISDSDAADLAGVALQENDVLLNITGDGVTFGRCCLVSSRILPACVNQHVVRIRCDKQKCVPGYLVSFLTHPLAKEYIESFNAGGSRRAVTKGHIESFAVPLPPLAEQQAIASILGALDDKLELNRQMSQTLEAMARAIFKSWFVDFDPIHEKIGGLTCCTSESYATSLFPAAFEDSELGPIPRGWSSIALPEVVDVNPNRSLRKGEITPYLDMANMPTQGHHPDAWIDRPFGSGTRFVNGDTLVARITPCLENGKTAMVTFLQETQVGWGSTEFIVLRPKPPLPNAYAYLLARSDAFRQFAIQRMSGSSGRQRVPVDSLFQYKMVKPPDKVASAFGTLVGPMFKRADVNAKEARALTALRDALLPKLISGELRIPDAERIVGRCI